MPAGLSPAEIGELFDRQTPAIYRRALALVGRRADAWDVVQEVFVRLLQSSHQFRREARPTTYVYRITTHLALNALRARAAREPQAALPPEEDAEPADASVQARAECRDFLLKLSGRIDERSLSIAALHYSDGLSQEEIADVMGLSRKTINRAVIHLRQVAQELGEPRPPSHEP
jgi:RNA polymerase sigma-70 factor, ECF subfamily